MCCYKLVTVEFKYAGIQNQMEKLIHKVSCSTRWLTSQIAMRDVLLLFHRQIFCWIDEWYGMTIEDIRRVEEETAQSINSVTSV